MIPTMQGVRFSVRNDRTGFIAYGCTITYSEPFKGMSGPGSVPHLDCYVSGLRSFRLRMDDVADAQFEAI